MFQGHGVIVKEQYWPKMTYEPIPPGGSSPGWVWFCFNKSDIDKAYEQHAKLILRFNDVATESMHQFESIPLSAGNNFPFH